LDLWKEAIELVVDIYELTKKFPKEEEYGLKSQLRRASVSVASNISEGLTRRTIPDKIHFMYISNGSLSEIDTQIEISYRLKFILESDKEIFEERLIKVQKLLSGLIRSLKK